MPAGTENEHIGASQDRQLRAIRAIRSTAMQGTTAGNGLSRPVVQVAGMSDTGDHKGRPYDRLSDAAGTAVGDGLVPSRRPDRRHVRHGRPRGSPLRPAVRRSRDRRRGRACPVPPSGSPARPTRATTRVAPTTGCPADAQGPRSRSAGMKAFQYHRTHPGVRAAWSGAVCRPNSSVVRVAQANGDEQQMKRPAPHRSTVAPVRRHGANR